MTEQNYKRTIRTFVRREGRITKAQARALDVLLPIYGLNCQKGSLDFNKIFNRKADTILEIGFGMGSSLLEIAKNNLDKNYIGIEVHRPGVGSFLNAIHEVQLTNVRVIVDDAVEALKTAVPNHSLDAIYIYFPDPWPKKRHHKRRMIQRNFVQLLHQKLKTDAILHLATDWGPYAEWMMEIMNQSVGFENLAGKGKFSSRPAWRPVTKFEMRGQRLGHDVLDLLFKAVSSNDVRT